MCWGDVRVIKVASFVTEFALFQSVFCLTQTNSVGSHFLLFFYLRCHLLEYRFTGLSPSFKFEPVFAHGTASPFWGDVFWRYRYLHFSHRIS